MEFQCRVIVQRRCTSCCSSVNAIPLQAERHSARRQKLFGFPPESAFTFRPECCSASHRNRCSPSPEYPKSMRTAHLLRCPRESQTAFRLAPSEPATGAKHRAIGNWSECCPHFEPRSQPLCSAVQPHQSTLL